MGKQDVARVLLKRIFNDYEKNKDNYCLKFVKISEFHNHYFFLKDCTTTTIGQIIHLDYNYLEQRGKTKLLPLILDDKNLMVKSIYDIDESKLYFKFKSIERDLQVGIDIYVNKLFDFLFGKEFIQMVESKIIINEIDYLYDTFIIPLIGLNGAGKQLYKIRLIENGFCIPSKNKYNDFLNTPYWKILSAKVKKDSNNICCVCNSDIDLHVHHKFYGMYGMEHSRDNQLICVCYKCHKKLHNIDN